VPQDYVLFNHRTIKENLMLALHKQKSYSKADKLNVIKQSAEQFNLLDHLEKFPCDLSGGQRQRVSILQQVLAGNKLILLDEPFSGLDSIMKDKVIDLLLKVSNLDEMNTLIIVSHDIESSCAISDTIIVLANDVNNPANGSTNIKMYDLIQEGLAYTSDIKSNPRFQAIVSEIKSIM
jgi:ABC-type nitrate/sulfonate/bicarbonate transport system ATPase subunit